MMNGPNSFLMSHAVKSGTPLMSPSVDPMIARVKRRGAALLCSGDRCCENRMHYLAPFAIHLEWPVELYIFLDLLVIAFRMTCRGGVD